MGKKGESGIFWHALGYFWDIHHVPKRLFRHKHALQRPFFIGRISLKIMYLAKERESDDSLLGGAFAKAQQQTRR